MELLFALLQGLCELLLQLAIEVLVEFGFHSMGRAASPKAETPSWLSTMSYLAFGFLAGFVSLLVFPALFVHSEWLQVANLVLTPFLVGALMSLLGSWRRKRGQPLVRLDRFAYAYAFAVAVAAARFLWGH